VELDIAQPAGTALDLPVALLGRHAVDDPPAHGPHVLDRLGPLGGRPDQRLQHGQPLLPERQVARGRARLEQGLELPRSGPPRVVRLVGGERARQGSLAPLGSQVRVDRPGHLPADLHQPGRDHLAVGQVLVTGADVDDVDVADVVQLPPTGLAHRDDGQPGRGAALGLGQPKSGREGGVGQRGQPGHRLLDVDALGEVVGRDPEQRHSVRRAQLIHRGRGQRVVRPAGAQGGHGAGPRDQVVAERGRRAEHRGQVGAQVGVGSQGLDDLRRYAVALLGLGDAVQLAQREVGFGRRGQRLQHLGGDVVDRALFPLVPQAEAARRLAEQGGRRFRIGESESAQPEDRGRPGHLSGPAEVADDPASAPVSALTREAHPWPAPRISSRTVATPRTGRR
jgi:hypothetical protein